MDNSDPRTGVPDGPGAGPRTLDAVNRNSGVRDRWPLLGVLLLALVAAACGTPADQPAPSGPPQLAGRALGGGFVAVSGSGFPAGSSASVVGTTPQGETTLTVPTDASGRFGASVPVPEGYRGPLGVRATAGSAAVSAQVQAEAGEPADEAGVRPLKDVACTTEADVEDLPSASPGDVVCLTGRSDQRLKITTGGSPGKPVVYSGGGDARVAGIEVTANHVVVEGFLAEDARSAGARLQGNDITFRDNRIDHPVNDGEDTDGLRFFGDDITILHNTITDVSDGSDCGNDGCGDGPHPDCMQSFYSNNYPTSSHVLIEGNRCDDIAAQCLIGEGPQLPSEGINGTGESTDWIFFNNYCDTNAAQAVLFKDITNVTVVGNRFDGRNNKAIVLDFASTGAHVGGNELGDKTPKLITFDDEKSAEGYIGPAPSE